MNLDAVLDRIEAVARAEGIECNLRETLAGNGHAPRWRAAFEALPSLQPSIVELRDAVQIGRIEDTHGLRRFRDTHGFESVPGRETTPAVLAAALREFGPWRKGPINLFGIEIDTEWRSDWKWSRVLPHISNLDGRRALDVGCANAYFGWRMIGAGARQVLGIDPSPGYFMQYLVVAGYLDAPDRVRRNLMVPCRLEDLAASVSEFDTVFSMGVLYHRRDPRAHIAALRERLRVGGELVIETLVVPGNEPLRPRERYARMRNVFEIPDLGSLVAWLEEGGLRDVRIVDVTATTPAEQRRTQWMPFESLIESLDPSAPSLTVEGHPAPMRAIALARR